MDKTKYQLAHVTETNISALGFIELPSMNTMEYAIEKLHILGFINDNYEITPTGFFANQLRFINLECRKLIFAGYHYGAYILDLITIATFVYVKKRSIFGKKFCIKNFINKTDLEFNFYDHIIIADDFINCILVWNIFQDFINDHIKNMNTKDATPFNKKLIYLSAIEKWCVDNELKLDGLLLVIAMRDQVIENMISLGLDPYKNSLGLVKRNYNLNTIIKNNLAEGIDEIRKLKYCIFEGFKPNILKLKEHEKYTSYVSVLKNITITLKSSLLTPLNTNLQKMPKYITIASYDLSKKQRSELFEFVTSEYVSVLDNYIDIDDKIFIN
jgi:HrpA-like RNA helicase